MKKSFILHNDSLEILKELSDEEAGKLFKAIASFNSGIELELERDIRMLFLPFKNQFVRDNSVYDTFISKQSERGKRSAELRKSKGINKKQPNPTSVNHSQPPSTLSTNNDSVSVNDSVSKNDSDSENKKVSKNKFIPPTVFDVENFFIENGYSKQLANKFNEHYEPDWKDSNGKKVKDWKKKARVVWFKESNKKNIPGQQSDRKISAIEQAVINQQIMKEKYGSGNS